MGLINSGAGFWEDEFMVVDMSQAPAFFEGSETDNQDDPDKSSQPKRLLGYKAGNAHLQFLSPRTAQQAQRLDDGCNAFRAL